MNTRNIPLRGQFFSDALIILSVGGGDGYAGSLAYPRECSAVSGACLTIRKELFLEMGGFNIHFQKGLRDVDLCLRLRRTGRRNIYTPQVVRLDEAIPVEEGDPIDLALLFEESGDVIEASEPYFNINFDRTRADYSLAPHADTGVRDV